MRDHKREVFQYCHFQQHSRDKKLLPLQVHYAFCNNLWDTQFLQHSWKCFCCRLHKLYFKLEKLCFVVKDTNAFSIKMVCCEYFDHPLYKAHIVNSFPDCFDCVWWNIRNNFIFINEFAADLFERNDGNLLFGPMNARVHNFKSHPRFNKNEVS